MMTSPLAGARGLKPNRGAVVANFSDRRRSQERCGLKRVCAGLRRAGLQLLSFQAVRPLPLPGLDGKPPRACALQTETGPGSCVLLHSFPALFFTRRQNEFSL